MGSFYFIMLPSQASSGFDCFIDLLVFLQRDKCWEALLRNFLGFLPHWNWPNGFLLIGLGLQVVQGRDRSQVLLLSHQHHVWQVMLILMPWSNSCDILCILFFCTKVPECSPHSRMESHASIWEQGSAYMIQSSVDGSPPPPPVQFIHQIHWCWLHTWIITVLLFLSFK